MNKAAPSINANVPIYSHFVKVDLYITLHGLFFFSKSAETSWEVEIW